MKRNAKSHLVGIITNRITPRKRRTMVYIEGSSDSEPSFKTQAGSPTRGALTFSLVMLQERLSNVQGHERFLIIPVVQNLDWDITNIFWRGTIMNDSGDAPSTSAYAPCRATSRILLHMLVHWRQLGINRKMRDKFEVSLSDIIEMAKLACSPARVALTKEEQIHIRNRLNHLYETDRSLKGFDSKEREITYRLINRSCNKGECNVY